MGSRRPPHRHQPHYQPGYSNNWNNHGHYERWQPWQHRRWHRHPPGLQQQRPPQPPQPPQPQSPPNDEADELELEASITFEDEEWDPEHWSARLRCPICFEFFKEPYVMACGHSWCNNCVDSIIRSQMEKTPNRPSEELSLACPSCRYTQTYGQYNSYAPRNLALEMTIESWNSSAEYKKYLTPKCDRSLQTNEEDIIREQEGYTPQECDPGSSMHTSQIKEDGPKMEQLIKDQEIQTEEWPTRPITHHASTQVSLALPSCSVLTQTPTVQQNLKENFSQTPIVRKRNKMNQTKRVTREASTQIMCQLKDASSQATQPEGCEPKRTDATTQTEPERFQPHEITEASRSGSSNLPTVETILSTIALKSTIPKADCIMNDLISPVDEEDISEIFKDSDVEDAAVGTPRATSSVDDQHTTPGSSVDDHQTKDDVAGIMVPGVAGDTKHGIRNSRTDDAEILSGFQDQSHVDISETTMGTSTDRLQSELPERGKRCAKSTFRCGSKFNMDADPDGLYIFCQRDVLMVSLLSVVIIVDWKYISSAFVHDVASVVDVASSGPHYSFISCQVVFLGAILLALSFLAVFYAVSYGIAREVHAVMVKK